MADGLVQDAASIAEAAMPALVHLPADTPAAEVLAALERDGALILDDALAPADLQLCDLIRDTLQLRQFLRAQHRSRITRRRGARDRSG